MRTRGDISVADLKRLVSYDKETGRFRWLDYPGEQVAFMKGRRADTPALGGYRHVRFPSIGTFRAHRLAWLYINGEWPDGLLDHKNHKRGDNRIDNLRLATRSQNMANRRGIRIGLKGVVRNGRRWKAVISVDKKTYHLGAFDTEERAHAVYCVAADHFFGEFAETDSSTASVPLVPPKYPPGSFGERLEADLAWRRTRHRNRTHKWSPRLPENLRARLQAELGDKE